MNAIHRIELWADTHHPKWIDLLRLLLGITFTVKGISFIGNSNLIVEILRIGHIEYLSAMIAHYVIAILIVGGIMIAIGLLTRTAVVLEIIVTLPLMFFVHLSNDFFMLNYDTGISILLILLLFFFLIYGSGSFSVDKLINDEAE